VLNTYLHLSVAGNLSALQNTEAPCQLQIVGEGTVKGVQESHDTLEVAGCLLHALEVERLGEDVAAPVR